MTKIDLSALLNRPGYGNAANELIKGGHWDATATIGANEYMVNMFVSVKVTADSAEQSRLEAFSVMDYTDVKYTQVVLATKEVEYK